MAEGAFEADEVVLGMGGTLSPLTRTTGTTGSNRVGRGLTEAEVDERLSRLPCVFSGSFDFGMEKLEQARQANWVSFKVFEYRGKE